MNYTRETTGNRINLMSERVAVGQPIAAIRCFCAGGEGRKRVWLVGGAPHTDGTRWLSEGAEWQFLNGRGDILCSWKITQVNPEPDEYDCYEFSYDYSGPDLPPAAGG
jgi:hypothetical protein